MRISTVSQRGSAAHARTASEQSLAVHVTSRMNHPSVIVFALGFIHAFLPETRGLEGEEIVTYDICSMQQVQIPPSLSSSTP